MPGLRQSGRPQKCGAQFHRSDLHQCSVPNLYRNGRNGRLRRRTRSSNGPIERRGLRRKGRLPVRTLLRERRNTGQSRRRSKKNESRSRRASEKTIRSMRMVFSLALKRALFFEAL
jgi:hypothetical protein